MRSKSITTLSAILVVLVLTTLSCGLSLKPGSKSDSTATPKVNQVTSAPVDVDPAPTQKPADPVVPPTAAPPTPLPTRKSQPTEAPVSRSQPYYTEEFNEVPDNWHFNILKGNEDKTDISVDDGKLVFTLEDYHTYAYVYYDDYTYTDVYLEAKVSNRGSNDNMITLVCRYSNIKTGMKTNTFAMSCEGNEIKLYVNGVLERTVADNTYDLPEGQVGVGVSSFYSTPVIIDFDYVTIAQP